MLFENRKQAVLRILTGGGLGTAACLLLAFFTQPGALFGGPLEFAFTFCYNSRVPDALGTAAGLALWFAFGAEIAVATLPFADGGKALLSRSALHFLLMALTLTAWVILNFGLLELSFFLPAFVLIYLLVWLGRWVGWCGELAAIRRKLGLAPGPSPLKWRETLPYVPFAALLCLLLPWLLSLLDAPDVPVLTGLLYPGLLLPLGGLCSGWSLGRRHGLCPLYPVMCALLTLCFVLLARLVSNVADGAMIPIALCSVLLGNAAGTLYRAAKERRIKK